MAVLLSGCFTTGHLINQPTVQSLRRGVTTYDEVRAQMGTPTTDTVLSDGRREITYIHATTSVAPLTFVPIVGIFFSGTRSNMQTLYLTFAPNDVLENHKLGTSNITTHIGL